MKDLNETPFLEIDPDHQALTGNLSALKQLRDAIGQIVDKGKKSELIGNGKTGIELIILDESLEGQPLKKSWKHRLLAWLLVALLCSIPFAALFGYYNIFKILIHFL